MTPSGMPRISAASRSYTRWIVVHAVPSPRPVFAHLAEHRGLALSRRQLLDGAWGAGWVGDERTVDVHVGQLRKKLGDGLELTTVWGVGYRLE